MFEKRACVSKETKQVRYQQRFNRTGVASILDEQPAFILLQNKLPGGECV